MEDWCMRCKNWKQREGEDTEGCPIWDLHLLYNYNESKQVAAIRDHFIPMDKKYNPLQQRKITAKQQLGNASGTPP